MGKLKNAVVLIFLLLGNCSFAQTITTINKLDTAYQHCLDKGQYMLGCAQLYEDQMDSMLNVVYGKLHAKYDSTEKMKLKNEELKWITERDKYFKKVWSQNNGLGNGLDSVMVNVDENARFIRSRVIELINKLNR